MELTKEKSMEARLKKNSNCGCTLAQAIFLMLLWNHYEKQKRA